MISSPSLETRAEAIRVVRQRIPITMDTDYNINHHDFFRELETTDPQNPERFLLRFPLGQDIIDLLKECICPPIYDAWGYAGRMARSFANEHSIPIGGLLV